MKKTSPGHNWLYYCIIMLLISMCWFSCKKKTEPVTIPPADFNGLFVCAAPSYQSGQNPKIYQLDTVKITQASGSDSIFIVLYEGNFDDSCQGTVKNDSIFFQQTGTSSYCCSNWTITGSGLLNSNNLMLSITDYASNCGCGMDIGYGGGQTICSGIYSR